MAIILEGPDAAGKTTLGRQLANMGMRLIVSGGAPKSPKEVEEYCEMQLLACNDVHAVLDRITPISHPIYNPVYKESLLLFSYMDRMVRRADVIVVYCRPPVEALMRPEKHQWKDYDTEAQKQKILANQMEYIKAYDTVFGNVPHMSYDYTERESDEAVELVAMLAATQHNPQAMAELKILQRIKTYEQR